MPEVDVAAPNTLQDQLWQAWPLSSQKLGLEEALGQLEEEMPGGRDRLRSQTIAFRNRCAAESPEIRLPNLQNSLASTSKRGPR